MLATVGSEPIGDEPFNSACYSMPLDRAKQAAKGANGTPTVIEVEDNENSFSSVTVKRGDTVTTQTEESCGAAIDWRKVMPTEKPDYTVGIGLEVLENLVKVAKEYAKHTESSAKGLTKQGRMGQRNIRLQFEFILDDDKAVPDCKPIQVTSGDLSVVLMPMRAPKK